MIKQTLSQIKAAGRFVCVALDVWLSMTLNWLFALFFVGYGIGVSGLTFAALSHLGWFMAIAVFLDVVIYFSLGRSVENPTFAACRKAYAHVYGTGSVTVDGGTGRVLEVR